jgi:uncharacterized damage-inducible protein DinB
MKAMTYYGAKELAEGFRTVRKNTLVIAEDIGEQHYGFRATPETRTIGQTLVHIAVSSKFAEQIHAVERRTTMAGFDFMTFFGPMQAAEQASHSKAQVIALLTENGDKFANWLDTLTDEFLGEEVSMMPGTAPAGKSRFEMILGVKEHEMHHRAQLMLLERMVGVVPHLTRQMEARMAEMMKAQQAAK